MIDIKKIYVEVFKAIKADTEMLDLLEIDYNTLQDNELTKRVRTQVIDTSKPEDLLQNYNTRICVLEEESYSNQRLETGYMKLTILITQDKNKIDRRVLKIVKRLIEILDTTQLQSVGKPKIKIGFDGLEYNRRIPYEESNDTGWDKYSIVFSYKYFN